MTTIVYNHADRQIAVDGRITAGNLIASDEFKKWALVGDEYWFLSGAPADFSKFIDYHNGKISGRPEFPINCFAFRVIDGECVEAGLTEDGEPWTNHLSYSAATGSGREHAITALDMGASAYVAVQMAAKRDTSTGGVITVFDLASMSFSGV